MSARAGPSAPSAHQARAVRNALELPSPTWTLALAGGGFLVGLAALYGDYSWWAHDQVAVWKTGPYLLWTFLICGQCALWAVVAKPLWSTVRMLDREVPGKRLTLLRRGLAFFVLVLGAVLAGTFLPDWKEWLHWHSEKVTIISIVGVLAVGMPAVTGIWLVHSAIDRLGQTKRPDFDLVVSFVRLRGVLHDLLLLLGGAIGLAILGAGAERNAMAVFVNHLNKQHGAHHLNPGAVFPPEYVLIYGFYFTALLALVYLPADRAMTTAGRHLRDTFLPLDPPVNEEFFQRCAQRGTFESLLGLNSSTSTNFRAGVAILTPLIGSLTALLLGK